MGERSVLYVRTPLTDALVRGSPGYGT